MIMIITRHGYHSIMFMVDAFIHSSQLVLHYKTQLQSTVGLFLQGLEIRILFSDKGHDPFHTAGLCKDLFSFLGQLEVPFYMEFFGSVCFDAVHASCFLIMKKGL